jgi:pyridoxine 5-phosphate synthase
MTTSTTTPRLGVNIDHVATLRQARGTDYPDIVEAARVCEEAGADGITVHLREDRRHIQDADVTALRARIRTRMNLEMANAPDIVRVACEVRPHEVCMVPERRQELTTEGGLDVAGQRDAIAASIERLHKAGIAVSLFIEADEAQIRAAARTGAEMIELHTGTYCEARGTRRDAELARLRAGADLAAELGLQVNAGHGLNTANLGGILAVPHLHTLNIGHSIVARAVFIGLAAAVAEMLAAMRGGGRAQA